MSVGQIEANLRHACQRGVKEIYLLDPTLNQRPDFAGFLRLLAQGNPDRQFTYSAELRAEGIRAETARLLREANFQEVEVGLQSVDAEAQKLMGRHVSLEAFERGARAMLDEGIRVRVDLILGLPGDTVDSVRRGLEYLDRVRPFSELQVFNLSILPGTAFRQTAGELGLEYQPRPPYYVLKTPTLDLEDLYGLMEEAQDVFGIVFDALPPPEVGEEDGIGDRDWRLAEITTAEGTVTLVHCRSRRRWTRSGLACGASCRSLAFTLWLKSADFRARSAEAAEQVRQVLADNPHTTLQVVLEPRGDPRHLTAEVLELLLAASHESLSYLDWFYSLHPVRLLGAKRLVVLLPGSHGGTARRGLARRNRRSGDDPLDRPPGTIGWERGINHPDSGQGCNAYWHLGEQPLAAASLAAPSPVRLIISASVGIAGELQSPTRRGQVHVFGQRFLLNFIRSRRKMDRTPDFAVLLIGTASSLPAPCRVAIIDRPARTGKLSCRDGKPLEKGKIKWVVGFRHSQVFLFRTPERKLGGGGIPRRALPLAREGMARLSSPFCWPRLRAAARPRLEWKRWSLPSCR